MREVIEEALGADAAGVLPESVRLSGEMSRAIATGEVEVASMAAETCELVSCHA